MLSRDFDGTLLFVSHDRYFINRVATKSDEVRGWGSHLRSTVKAELESWHEVRKMVSEEVQVASAWEASD